MPSEVKLPRLGQGMESGTVVKWLKAEGDAVEKGEPLYELDTEKVTQEVEAEAAGVLLKIAVPEGEVPVGTTLAFIGERGEAVPDATPGASSQPEPAAAQVPVRPPALVPVPSPEPEPADGRVKASPLARRIARERGIDLSVLRGTGPEGRIVAEDVESGPVAAPAIAAAAAALAAPVAPEREPLSSVRRTIARRLTEAWTVPAFQLTVSADMTRAQEVRGRLVERTHEGDAKPTLTDLLTKLCAVALMRHREVNAAFADEAIELYPAANVGIAVASPKGLVVPVIHDADRKTVAEIAADRSGIVERARAGRLTQADLEGGTFTISNLGPWGIEQFVAVLNPPQAAILAVGATEDRPVVREGELLVLPMMTLTLTCDHRAIDGATGADFLRTVKESLEEPGIAL